MRVHQDGAPALEAAEQECVGTSRGGRTTKIHALVDLDGNAIKLILTPGNLNDITAAPELVAGLGEVVVVADKGYDSDAFRADIANAGNEGRIPKRKGHLVSNFGNIEPVVA